MDAGNLLKPLLARGELRCVGATTLDEYRQYIEKESGPPYELWPKSRYDIDIIRIMIYT